MKRTAMLLLAALGIVYLADVAEGQLVPVHPRLVPNRVGVVNAIHDFWFESNTSASADLAGLGFRSIKFWPTMSVASADVRNVIENPAFDVIVLRPLQNTALVTEIDCGGSTQNYYRWEADDYGDVAATLYQLYGNLSKTIILTGWEADNQIKGLGCTNRTPSQQEQDAFLQLLETRQAGVEAVRSANETLPLRVYHAIEVSHVLSSPFRVIDEIVPRLTRRPDMVSFSAWTTDLSEVGMTAALDHILNQVWSIPDSKAFNESQMFIGEYGRKERPCCNIYNAIYSRFAEAFDWGVSLGFYWNYRDQFLCPKDVGRWLRRCDDSLSTAYGALTALQTAYEDNN